jgi:cathepsin D
MAYPALAEKGVTPVFDEMMNQKLLASNMFAFYLTTKEEEEGMDHKSDLTLGYYDKTKFTGNLDWHDIKLKYMFGVQLDDMRVGGKSLGVCQSISHECLITFDSGTSLGSVPV